LSGALNILITGANGQLGQALRRIAPANMHVTGLNHADLDIGDADSVQRAIDSTRPDVVINAAAYTAVDKAETEIESARRVNATGPTNIATALKQMGHGRLIHVSTDFVFDGQASSPYSTDAVPHPLSVYGRTKFEGDCAVRSLLDQRSVLVRTAWLYSSSGKNFMLTMLRLMRERGEVRVVADQVGTPTSANSLARVIWQCAVRANVSGIYHWTDAGTASWYDFAVAIAEEATVLGLVDKLPKVLPIATADYPTPAKRPAYSVLDKSKSYLDLQIEPVHWREELRMVLGELNRA